MNSCPQCGLVDQLRNLKQGHLDGTGLDRIEDGRSLTTLDLGQGVVVLKDRDEKPPRCAGCLERSKHRLGLTIGHRLVAVVWLCDRHKRLVEYGSWSFQIEPNYGVPWHEI